jgi:hypothetical protein
MQAPLLYRSLSKTVKSAVSGTPRIIGLGILSLQPDEARFQVNAIPGERQDFPAPHFCQVCGQVNALQELGRRS